MPRSPKIDPSQQADVPFLRSILVALISGTLLTGSLCAALAYRQGAVATVQVASIDEPQDIQVNAQLLTDAR